LCPSRKMFSVQGNIIRASQFTTKPHRSCSCPQEIVEKIDSGRWYHAIEIQPGCFTPGKVRPKTRFVDYPQTSCLADKKVLDIGAWDGGYTFLMEQRGAEVTAFDIQDPSSSGFNRAKEILGSKAKHILGSVYDLDPLRHGTYDIVLFFGVFYHLFDPVRALFNINRVLKEGGILLFEGAILDYAYNVDETWRPMLGNMEAYTTVPLSYYTSKTYWNDWSTWYVPNKLCLQEWIRSAGFEVTTMNAIERNSRGYGLATKIGDPMFEHEVLQYKQK